MVILEVQQLIKKFQKTTAVDGVSFSINAGSCFGLLGPNGAGKSTTIEIMEGIIKPTSGKVLYKGKSTGKQFKQEAGVQFQSTALMDFITTREILTLFSRLYPKPLPIDELVKRCQLEEFLDQYATKLSGGQKQRLLLALALVNDPEILFLDEPTTGLDPQSRRNFWALIESIKAQGKTVILTTHYMDEAELLCDHLVIMDHGKIIAQGAPSTLLNQHFKDRCLRINKSAIENHLEQLTEPYQINGDTVEITSQNLNASLTTLMAMEVEIDSLQVTPRNLEDLFIKLTGRKLRA